MTGAGRLPTSSPGEFGCCCCRWKNDLAGDGDVHRRGGYDRDGDFHESGLSSGRAAERICHHDALGGRRAVRAVRGAVVCGAGRGAAAVGWRVSFSEHDLSPGGGISRGVDFRDGGFRRAGGAGGDGFWPILRGGGAGGASAGAVARGGVADHAGAAARCAAAQRVSKCRDAAQGRAGAGDHRRGFLRDRCRAGFVSPGIGRWTTDRQRAVCDQSRLRDVRLLGLECLDLHRGGNAQSGAGHSALGRARHAARGAALSGRERGLSPQHAAGGDGG